VERPFKKGHIPQQVLESCRDNVAIGRIPMHREKNEGKIRPGRLCPDPSHQARWIITRERLFGDVCKRGALLQLVAKLSDVITYERRPSGLLQEFRGYVCIAPARGEDQDPF
jgi:hypothetical protein